ncbi:MAG: heavy-metal-associated domain-containing protein [bacterium]
MSKKFITITVVALLGAALLFCCRQTNEKAQTEKPEEFASVNVQKVKLDVQGMTCSGCVVGVESALSKVDGVKKAEVDLGAKLAEVQFDPEVAQVEQLVDAVNKAGFKAKVAQLN